MSSPSLSSSSSSPSSSSSNLRVLIVGASIAGPTAAYWFARAGATVTVIERFPALRTAGQSIDIRTAGVTVMRKMGGMEASVRAATTAQAGIEFVRDDGRPYARMAASGDPDRQNLTSEYEIFRGDLARILYDLTRRHPAVTYVFGDQVASMRYHNKEEGEDQGPVTVEFANGRLPTAEYDLVVACDGATSRTRAMGFGCGVRDHIRPVNCWAAYFSTDKDLLHGGKMAQMWSGVGGRCLALGPDPAGGNRAGALGIYPNNHKNRDATLPFREAMKEGDDAVKRYVAGFFGSGGDGGGWTKTGEILQAMTTGAGAEDFYASEIVQVKVPSLSRGRFVLVGDAGYCPSPFTGAGTTLAIAGAYVLAGEISSRCNGKGKGSGSDIAAALKAYEERMRPMIDDLQQIPPGMPGLLAPQTAWGIWLRNMLLSFIAWSRFLEVFGSLFAGSFGNDKYKLPDYEWVAEA